MNKILNDSFSIIPNFILADKRISPSDKLVYQVLFGFRMANKCWASNEYISERTGLSIPTINRSLLTLEGLGFIFRETKTDKAGKQRTITIPHLDSVLPNDQNDQANDQDDQTPMIRMIRPNDQDDQSIYKNNIQVRIDKKETPPNPLKGEIVLPSHLNTELGRNSFIEWLEHKRQIGKSYKAIGLKKLISQLGKDYKTDLDLKHAIDHSIGNNYQGIYAGSKKENKHYETRGEKNARILKENHEKFAREEREGTKTTIAFLEGIL